VRVCVCFEEKGGDGRGGDGDGMGWDGDGDEGGFREFEGSWRKRGRRMMMMRVRGMRKLRTGGRSGRVCGR